jgi:hypothetical protein
MGGFAEIKHVEILRQERSRNGSAAWPGREHAQWVLTGLFLALVYDWAVKEGKLLCQNRLA